MALEWMPRDNEPKDHSLHRQPHWGTEAPCVMYEKKPLTDDEMVTTLTHKNVKIARRTITKYRKELNIPSANKRKRIF